MPLGQLPCNRVLDARHHLPVQRPALPHDQEQDHALVEVARPPLPDAQRLGDLGREAPLQHGVNVGAAEPDAAGVEHAVRPAQHQDATRLGVEDAEVALRPRPVEAVKVRAAVLLARRRRVVVPQEQGHVGERSRGDEVACLPGGEGLALAAVGEVVVVHGDGDAQGAADAAAYVDGRQGVFEDETAGLLCCQRTWTWAPREEEERS